MTRFYTLKKRVYHKLEKFFPNVDSDKVIYDFINKNFSEIIEKYKTKNEEFNIKKSNENIWVFWWQGYENAPKIVKKCIESIRIHSNGHMVVLITSKNWKQYIDIPDFIIKKLETKKISLTHFSDILRMALISKNGGLWLDATIYVSSDILEEYFSLTFFSIKYSTSTSRITKGRWTGFCQAGKKNSLLQSFCYEIFYEYWRKNNYLIDYFLIDYIISYAYNNIPQIKQNIDNLEANNEGIKLLDLSFNEPYNEEKYKQILSTSIFFKLNWKKQYLEESEGLQTLYKYFISN